MKRDRSDIDLMCEQLERLTLESSKLDERMTDLRREIAQEQDQDWNAYTVKELRAICKALKLRGYSRLRKHELIEVIQENDGV
jgi:hypothetical protein